MRYLSESGVEIGAWAAIGADIEIRYVVLPSADTIEFTIGGRHGLDLDMSEAGLRRCITAFSEALDEFNTIETDGADATSSDQVEEAAPHPTPRTAAPPNERTGGPSFLRQRPRSAWRISR